MFPVKSSKMLGKFWLQRASAKTDAQKIVSTVLVLLSKIILYQKSICQLQRNLISSIIKIHSGPLHPVVLKEVGGKCKGHMSSSSSISGTFKILLINIRKGKPPYVFKENTVKSWILTTELIQILVWHVRFSRFVKSNKGTVIQKVLILLDKWSTHNTGETGQALLNVTIGFSPMFEISRLQPGHLSDIASWKSFTNGACWCRWAGRQNWRGGGKYFLHGYLDGFVMYV